MGQRLHHADGRGEGSLTRGAAGAGQGQNLFFASLGVPLVAGLLYPFFGLLLSPIVAAATMSFSSVSVIGNALRLRRVAP